MAPLLRPAPNLEPHAEITREALLEQQILATLENVGKEVGGLRGQVRDLRTVLLGAGDGGETAFGRLPMVENKVAAVEVRVGNLESSTSQLQAYRNNASGIGKWVAGFIGLAIGTVLASSLMLLLGKMLLGK